MALSRKRPCWNEQVTIEISGQRERWWRAAGCVCSCIAGSPSGPQQAHLEVIAHDRVPRLVALPAESICDRAVVPGRGPVEPHLDQVNRQPGTQQTAAALVPDHFP